MADQASLVLRRLVIGWTVRLGADLARSSAMPPP
jgi:hypothetical protein